MSPTIYLHTHAPALKLAVYLLSARFSVRKEDYSEFLHTLAPLLNQIRDAVGRGSRLLLTQVIADPQSTY